MTQRTTEWLETSRQGDIAYLGYHERQHEESFQSTIAFCHWLESFGLLSPETTSVVADIAAGMGANTLYMARRYPKATFIGIDLDPLLVQRGNEYLKRSGQMNCRLVRGDLYQLDSSHTGAYDGIVNYQTLSWLPDYQAPLQSMLRLRPNWLALTSLFFDGDINCRIEIQDYTCPVAGKPYRETFYNTYALPLIQRCCADAGYRSFDAVPFEIAVDLPRPATRGLGTYTLKTEDGRRLQMTGPLLLNWYFVLARR